MSFGDWISGTRSDEQFTSRGEWRDNLASMGIKTRHKAALHTTKKKGKKSVLCRLDMEESLRMDGVAKARFTQMVRATEAALRPGIEHPIILDVRGTAVEDYCLAYYPVDFESALSLLQNLALLNGSERGAALLHALTGEDTEHLVLRYCGSDNVGLFVRCTDMDNFDAFLYVQRCRLTECVDTEAEVDVFTL